MTPLHTLVAERAQAADIAITAAGVAEIDRLLVEARAESIPDGMRLGYTDLRAPAGQERFFDAYAALYTAPPPMCPYGPELDDASRGPDALRRHDDGAPGAAASSFHGESK
ncbi:MAG: hypothetical protein HOQ28_19565 [Thermoleophilia bacterium]|nr:hypothetical protein [Thermoleophilia bacterium]